MIIDIAFGIVLAVILLYVLGFVLTVAGAAISALFEHLGTILMYGLLALVGFAGILVLSSLIESLGLGRQ